MVIYEYPRIFYKLDREKKFITDKTEPTIQLKCFLQTTISPKIYQSYEIKVNRRYNINDYIIIEHGK